MIEWVPGCECDECRSRWFSDLIKYAMQLEKGVLQAKILIVVVELTLRLSLSA